ncbi:16S rRNA (guanine(966)-N(2))-methyltransferase RsmD [Phaeospirillum tilakii]|uniref:16S rRNA (Guanine(966)-N(2))-methyltransferase RsmD n=1 Tax=Phaeospirillum tilakii TaxID=741673 RepID=A0ABW5CEH4_9PROT
MLRLVAGTHRGRRLVAPPGRIARPTADRVRQALFDMLAHGGLVELEEARVVDAFAGSGALGLEALSRGAARAWFLDTHPESLAAIRANVASLGEEGRARVLRADATRPPPAEAACDLLLLDPPYHQGLGGAALGALDAAGWVAPGALAVIEVAADEDLVAPPGFTLADQRGHGPARLFFLRKG